MHTHGKVDLGLSLGKTWLIDKSRYMYFLISLFVLMVPSQGV